MICGHCGLGEHDRCNGFLKTSFEFCRCADRGHADEQQWIAERNEAIYLKAVQSWFKRQDEAH